MRWANYNLGVISDKVTGNTSHCYFVANLFYNHKEVLCMSLVWYLQQYSNIYTCI